jgi:hypothetical protein
LAPHNVAIATFVGLWMLRPALILVTWPWRTWSSLRRTSYALKDRRAIVVEPGRLWTKLVRSYFPEVMLPLLRCEEQRDGSGDSIFENRTTWARAAQPWGVENHEGASFGFPSSFLSVSDSAA